MDIPKFKPSRTFVDGISLACLHARIKNSAVTGLGTAERAGSGKDPKFDVYLRSETPTEITPWQSTQLTRLFQRDELCSALVQGMKEYEESTGYDDSEMVRRDGILAHLSLSLVVIDDTEKEVILCARTLVDGNLDEHGIAIHLKAPRWGFASLDYLSDYLAKVRPAESPSAEQWRAMDPSALFGTWDHVPGAGGVVMKLELTIEPTRICQTTSVMGIRTTLEYRWSVCESNGEQIRFNVRWVGPGGHQAPAAPITFRQSKDCLRWQDWVLKRRC